MKLKSLIAPSLVLCFSLIANGCARTPPKPIGPFDPCMDTDQNNILGLFANTSQSFNKECATLTTVRLLAKAGKSTAAKKLLEYMVANNPEVQAEFEEMKAKGLISEKDFEPTEAENEFNVTESTDTDGTKRLIFHRTPAL